MIVSILYMALGVCFWEAGRNFFPVFFPKRALTRAMIILNRRLDLWNERARRDGAPIIRELTVKTTYMQKAERD